MKTLFLAVLTVSSFSVFSQYHHDNLKIMRTSYYGYDSAENHDQYDLQYTFKNLRLYPIVSNQEFKNEHKEIGSFLLLDDAIRDKKIVISETGATDQADPVVGEPERRVNRNSISNDAIQQQEIQSSNIGGDVSGRVNTLIAQNTSTDTIFIMAGEVVKGGKQDRVLANDVIIAPGEKVDLNAFCVEKNRWETKDQNGGKFTGYWKVSSMDIRKAATELKSQHAVWSTVEVHTKKNKADSETKAYTQLEKSKDYRKELDAYMSKFKGAFDQSEDVIGFIAVTDDRVIGCDLFATHDLFVDAYDNLIHSYVGNAITNGDSIKISNKEVYAYLDKLLKSEEGQEETIEDNGTLYKWKNKKLHITTY